MANAHASCQACCGFIMTADDGCAAVVRRNETMTRIFKDGDLSVVPLVA